MSKKDDKLQLISFEVNEENTPDRKVFILKLPQELKKLIADKIGKNKYKGYEFNFKMLRRLSTFVSPNILYCCCRGNEIIDKDEIWIYSLEKFNLDVLKVEIERWFNEDEDLINKLGEGFTFKESWQWSGEICSKDLFKYKNNIYNTIPALFANDISKEEIFFSKLEKYLKFNVLVTEETNSVITLPYEYDETKEPFSYEMKFKLINQRDYYGKYFLNVELCTKIWHTKSFFGEDKLYLKGKEATSIYIYKENPYFKNSSIYFTKLRIRNRNNVAEGDEIVDKIYANQLELDINEIVTSPREHIHIKDGIICLVTNKDKKNRKTQTGAGLSERNEVFNIIRKKYPSLVSRKSIGSIDYITVKKKEKIGELDKYLLDTLESNFINKDTKIPLNPYYINSIPNNMYLEVYTDNDVLFSAIREATRTLLRLTMPVDDITYKSIDGYEVIFVKKSADIARALNQDESPKKRVIEIESSLRRCETKNEMILSIIDIKPFHAKNQIKSLDSKSVVRTALKNQKRINQFINEFKKDSHIYKTINAVKDLLSAAGFVEQDYLELGLQDKILVGLNRLQDANENILVMSKILNGDIKVKFFGDKKWYTLRESLLEISIDRLEVARNKFKEATKSYNKIMFNDWIVDELQKILDENDKETYLFVSAALRQNVWPFVQNNKLDVDTLGLEEDCKKKLKVIRVNDTYEIGDYFINDWQKPNKKQGLFTENYSTYYSIGQRPDTIQHKVNITKLEMATKPLSRPNALEFIITGEKNEEKKLRIAQEAHVLRLLNLTYDTHTTFPLPLYVINRHSEYINAIKDIYENKKR